jgi:hypothetical protein
MKIMVLVAVGVSVLPILVALTMPDWYLGDKQNAREVSEEQLVGEDGDCD